MIVWIDVGTHKAQEYKSVFGSNSWFLIRLIRHSISTLVLRRRPFVGFPKLFSLVKARNSIRSLRSQFRVAFVEANSQLLKVNEYSHADDVFCLAMAGGEEPKLTLTKLYHAHNDQQSQGNSIYTTKDNISLNQFSLCPRVSADAFTSEYKVFLDSIYDEYEVILRINCEGSEDDVIYAFSKHFKDKFKVILGSLKDVKGVKGEEPYHDMMEHIESNGLLYSEWFSIPEHSHNAHNAILHLIKSKY